MDDGWVEDVMNPRQCPLELWKLPRSVGLLSILMFFWVPLKSDLLMCEEKRRDHGVS